MLGYTFFSKPEETDIEIVQVEFLDPPFGDKPLFVGLYKALLLFGTYSCKGVIWWISENDENLSLALNPIRSVLFFSKFWKKKLRLDFFLRWFPTGQGIGEINARPLVAIVPKTGPHNSVEAGQAEGGK